MISSERKDLFDDPRTAEDDEGHGRSQQASAQKNRLHPTTKRTPYYTRAIGQLCRKPHGLAIIQPHIISIRLLGLQDRAALDIVSRVRHGSAIWSTNPWDPVAAIINHLVWFEKSGEETNRALEKLESKGSSDGRPWFPIAEAWRLQTWIRKQKQKDLGPSKICLSLSLSLRFVVDRDATYLKRTSNGTKKDTLVISSHVGPMDLVELYPWCFLSVSTLRR